MRFGKIGDLKSKLTSAMKAAQDHIFSVMHPEGFWCGELEADTTLVSDYVFVHTLLGTRDEGRLQKAARQILSQQNEDGGWPIYEGGPSNISASVKAYFALKMTGHTPDEPEMV